MSLSTVDLPISPLPLLVTVPEAARLLGITRSAAYRCVAAGDLASTRLAGRLYVLTASITAVTSVE